MQGFGVDRLTGKPLEGWPHVVQSVEVIFSTRIAERVMRRHFGSAGPVLLGRAMNVANVLRFWFLVTVALELWEPRFKVVRVLPKASAEEARLGHMAFVITGEYRPRGHLGDPTPEGSLRKILVEGSETEFEVVGAQ